MSKRAFWIFIALVALAVAWYIYNNMPTPQATHGQPITYPGSNPANPGGVGYSVLNG